MSTHSPPFRVPAFQVEQHDPLVDDEHGVMPWMIDSRGSKYEISKTLRSLDRLLALIDVKVLLKRACVGLNKSSQTTALLLQPNTSKSVDGQHRSDSIAPHLAH